MDVLVGRNKILSAWWASQSLRTMKQGVFIVTLRSLKNSLCHHFHQIHNFKMRTSQSTNLSWASWRMMILSPSWYHHRQAWDPSGCGQLAGGFGDLLSFGNLPTLKESLKGGPWKNWRVSLHEDMIQVETPRMRPWWHEFGAQDWGILRRVGRRGKALRDRRGVLWS